MSAEEYRAGEPRVILDDDALDDLFDEDDDLDHIGPDDWADADRVTGNEGYYAEEELRWLARAKKAQ